MKIFGWMQNKLPAKPGSSKKKHNSISVNNHILQQEPKNQEFSDWPHGLLAIGTFGNKEIKQDSKSNDANIQENNNASSSQDRFQELSLEQVEKLQKDINLFLHTNSSDNNTEGEENGNYEEENSVIIGRGRGMCVDNTGRAIKKKSVSFLLKKMLVCRGGFTPTLNLKDQVPESRMEKILRAILHKKIYPQNPNTNLNAKKYLEKKQNLPNGSAIPREDDDETNQKDDDDDKGSKWVNTDSEYIVLEI